MENDLILAEARAGAATEKATSLVDHRSSLERRALEVHQRAGHLIDVLGVANVPAEPVLVSFRNDNEWVIFDAAIDPHLQAKEGLAMPRKARSHLKSIHKTGAPFCRLFIAHELAPGSIKKIAPNGKVDLATAETIIKQTSDPRPQKIAEATTTTLAAIGVGLAALGAGALVVAAAPLALLAAIPLDPAIIGAVSGSGRGEPGELAVFFHLVSWT